MRTSGPSQGSRCRAVWREASRSSFGRRDPFPGSSARIGEGLRVWIEFIQFSPASRPPGSSTPSQQVSARGRGNAGGCNRPRGRVAPPGQLVSSRDAEARPWRTTDRTRRRSSEARDLQCSSSPWASFNTAVLLPGAALRTAQVRCDGSSAPAAQHAAEAAGARYAVPPAATVSA